MMITESAFLSAARVGFLKLVLLYIEENRGNVAKLNAVDKDDNTALILAAREGHIVVVKALLSAEGINVNAANQNNGFTALLWAAHNGHIEVVHALLCFLGIRFDSWDHTKVLLDVLRYVFSFNPENQPNAHQAVPLGSTIDFSNISKNDLLTAVLAINDKNTPYDTLYWLKEADKPGTHLRKRFGKFEGIFEDDFVKIIRNEIKKRDPNYNPHEETQKNKSGTGAFITESFYKQYRNIPNPYKQDNFETDSPHAAFQL